MVKKVLFVGAGVVLLLGLLFGRDACSYVSTSAGWVRDTVKQNVPIKFEIDRARRLIAGLEKDIQNNTRKVIREEVEIAKLGEDMKGHKESLATARNEMLRLSRDLKSGSESFRYSNVSYTAAEVKEELRNRLERFKVKEATTDNLVKILNARTEGLTAAQEKIRSMEAAKRQLTLQVQNLEARLEMLEVSKAKSEFHFDDSSLSRARKLIGDIEARLEVDERILNSKGSYTGEIKLDDESDEETSDIVDQVTDYFGEGRAEVESLVGIEE